MSGPGGAATPARVEILPRRARPFFARHPWVFAGSIGRVVGRVEPGSEVVVFGAEGDPIARGLINPSGNLRVRLYRWDDGPLVEPFWRARIGRAVALRRDLPGDLLAPGAACRLVSSEADGLSGLTVDRYGPFLVAQFTARALWERRRLLLDIVAEQVPHEGIAVRFDPKLVTREGLDAPPAEEVRGAWPDAPIEVVENELRWLVDLRGGQKTGAFLDQRDNRRAAAAHARGRRVLDLFTYAGGFALTIARHGQPAEVVGVDSSAPAIELARRNATLNGLEATVRFEQGDVGRTLEAMRSRGERFGLVVCDPPKFARSAREVDDALRAYLALNRAAVDVLEPGGILVSCSCSGIVDRSMLGGVLAQVAELSGRDIQILEARGQPPDHPVLVSCPETAYLSCLIARVG